MKNMDTLEVHTSSPRPPGHRYLPLTVGMTEPTLPGRYTCMSSSRIASQCSAVQADRQNLPDKGPTMDFFTAWPVQQLSTLQYSLFR